MPLCASDMRVDNEVMLSEGGTGSHGSGLSLLGERAEATPGRSSLETDSLLGDFCPQRSENLICQEPLLSEMYAHVLVIEIIN